MPAAPVEPPPLTVVIADDHDLFASALALALAPIPDLQVVGRARDGHEALAEAAARSPDVVLMDVDMPRLDGIRATRLLRKLHPRTAVVVVSASHDAETAAQARSAGASAYVFKGCPVEDVAAAAREAVLPCAEVDAA
jgi:DNA-binding NarL/FixJ family response regulator